MDCAAKAKILSAFGLVALMLCSSGGGCGSYRVRWNPLLGCLERPCLPRSRPYLADPMPYGYYETCWQPWPNQCVGRPLEAIEVESDAQLDGNNEPLPRIHRLPDVKNLEDLEVLPMPPASPTPTEDPGAEVPPEVQGVPADQRGIDSLPSLDSLPIRDAEAKPPAEAEGLKREGSGTQVPEVPKGTSIPESETRKPPIAANRIPERPATSQMRPSRISLGCDSDRDGVVRIVAPPRKSSRRQDALVQPASATELPREPGGKALPLGPYARQRGIIRIETWLPSDERLSSDERLPSDESRPGVSRSARP